MFQPEVKLEFVRRYCPPADGWKVLVDIDASEEGRTGSERQTDASKQRQVQMGHDAERVHNEFKKVGVTVGGARAHWFKEHGFPRIPGDRDIIAFHQTKKTCVVAEVEGQSAGQPEQKLYKAIGQLVMARSTSRPSDWHMCFVLVVYGKEMERHLRGAGVLAEIGISALSLVGRSDQDEWLFGRLP